MDNNQGTKQSESKEICEKCGEEPVFMNGLCVYCYEDKVYGTKNFENRKKSPDMIVHGSKIKDPHQMEIDRKRSVSKILKIQKKNKKK